MRAPQALPRSPSAVLPQATYVVTHEAVGEQEIFLVPIGRDDDGVRDEAAFA